MSNNAILSYPHHFLEDLENMTPAERADRCDFLISWVKRYSTGSANPKWLEAHMYELARLAEMMRGTPTGINSTTDT